MVSLRVLTFACAATTPVDARFWILLAVSVARCLRWVSENEGTTVRANVHKDTAVLQLVELCIGVIEDLIFEVTRKGICALVLVFRLCLRRALLSLSA